jgi:ABC-type Fe3+/spermidine/putrescine transport system ATPase subunit
MTEAPPSNSGLDVDGVSVRYGSVQALSNLSLHVDEGEHLTIVGPSGSGKSTLLRCIAGLHMPDAGAIRWRGEVWTDAAHSELTPPERRRIGWMTQQPALWPHLSAIKHLIITLKWRGMARSIRRREAQRLLELVALSHRSDHRPSQLSGGEAQRLALARALCGMPTLLLLDEPLGQLDVLLRETIAKVIRDAAAAVGATVLHVTHDPAGILDESDRLGVIEEGRMIQLSSVSSIRRDPPTPFAAAVARLV